jgi:hypothetical protein
VVAYFIQSSLDDLIVTLILIVTLMMQFSLVPKGRHDCNNAFQQILSPVGAAYQKTLHYFPESRLDDLIVTLKMQLSSVPKGRHDCNNALQQILSPVGAAYQIIPITLFQTNIELNEIYKKLQPLIDLFLVKTDDCISTKFLNSK